MQISRVRIPYGYYTFERECMRCLYGKYTVFIWSNAKIIRLYAMSIRFLYGLTRNSYGGHTVVCDNHTVVYDTDTVQHILSY